MPSGMEVGLDPDHIVLDGDPATSPKNGHSPQFSADVCCRKTAEWIIMPLGTMVGLGQGNIVLDAVPALLPKRHKFRSMSVVAKFLRYAFYLIPCGRISWLLVSFWAHVNILDCIVSYRHLKLVNCCISEQNHIFKMLAINRRMSLKAVKVIKKWRYLIVHIALRITAL